MTAMGGTQVRSMENALDTARGIAHRRFMAVAANARLPKGAPPVRRVTTPTQHAQKIVQILSEVVDDAVIDRWRINRVEIRKNERTE